MSSVDITGKKEYICYYEEGILRRSVQCSVVLEKITKLLLSLLQMAELLPAILRRTLFVRRIVLPDGRTISYENDAEERITKVTDKVGNVESVTKYAYGAWGVCTVTKDGSGCKIADINPFRYKGYYMDLETGMYYLLSRYYDAEVGRFANADAVINNSFLFGTDLFVYCYNAPVEYYDDSDLWPTLSVSKTNSNTYKVELSDKLRRIATYLAISACVDAIGAAICAFIPGAQVGALIRYYYGIKKLACYLLDKYGGKRVYVSVKYEIKTKSYTYWIFWPFVKGTTTVKTLYIKKISTGWRLR